MEEQKFYRIILRHDVSTQWMINDPILLFGEYGVEDDTHRIKRGDGQTKWSELTYEQFGLEYLISYTNLKGEVEDNEKLVLALSEKLNVKDFNSYKTEINTELSNKANNQFSGEDVGLTSTTISDAIKELKTLIDSLPNTTDTEEPIEPPEEPPVDPNPIVPPAQPPLESKPSVPGDIVEG